MSLRINSRGSIKNQAGFTLIELLVVVAIIGLLSTFVLAGLDGAKENARVVKAEEEVRVLYQALLAYNLSTNSWPPGCNNIDTVAEWNAPWKTGYIDASISADPWGTSYFFDGCPNVECLPGRSSVCSAGANKAHGSFNRADMTPQGDDICIYFEPEC